MIISLAFSDNGLSPPEVKLITANYDTARVDDDCSPDEVSRDEVKEKVTTAVKRFYCTYTNPFGVAFRSFSLAVFFLAAVISSCDVIELFRDVICFWFNLALGSILA